MSKATELLDMLEAKQVGVLYHYTSIVSLLKILEEDSLKASHRRVKDAKGETIGIRAISFTRNKNFHKQARLIGGLEVRLVLDGDKLSNKFKITPFADLGASLPFANRKSSDVNQKREQEEIIVVNEIKPISKYIKSIDIIVKDRRPFPDNIQPQLDKSGFKINTIK